MTRTQLLEIANEIIKNSLDTYEDNAKRGTIYTGLYRKRPMCVFVSRAKVIICITYNKVAYFTNGTDKLTAPRLRSFCEDHDCNTRVYLYPEAKRLFSDVEGVVESSIDKRISYHFDYNDIIPISYKA